MAKYLITGGCGFIGSHLSNRLIELGHEVVAIDNLSSSSTKYISPKARLIIKDIRTPRLLEDEMQNVDACFHLAAISSVFQGEKNWVETREVNLIGSIYAFDAAIKNNCPILFASSAAIYGNVSDSPITESSTAKPISSYGTDKLCSEIYAKTASQIHGLRGIATRLFNVYGDFQNSDSPYSGVISIFNKSYKEKKSITIYGNGEQIRDFIYVKDVVEIMIQLMQREHTGFESVNVCSGIPTSINELANHIKEITTNDVTKNYLPARNGDIKLSVGCNKKLKKLLSNIEFIPIRSGLESTIESEYGK